jgi:hypothetical protein
MYLKADYSTRFYASIKLWWEAEIQNLNDWSDYVTKNLTEWKFNTNQSFSVKPNRDGILQEIL